MAAPRTTVTHRVQSFQIRPDGCAGNVWLLRWFQEAAYANSIELGFTLDWYKAQGISWVMRESDLLIVERPRYDETIHITTWIADLGRVQAFRQYEARRADGTPLARCNTQWIMLNLHTQRPTRLPAVMTEVFEPAQDFALAAIGWPTVEGAPFRGERTVAFYEEDELGHVNNAIYLNWIEENARLAARAAGLPAPHFQRHRLEYRLPAFKDDRLALHSALAPHASGLAWHHEIWRGDELLVRADSLSEG